jgi:hypothetical protein
MQKSQKLYCYVDETGQDTKGQLFIVVAVVVNDERDRLNSYLEGAEVTSGIGLKKWVRAKRDSESRNQYLRAANKDNFEGRIYYSGYVEAGTAGFEELTVNTIAKAIGAYVAQQKTGFKYKVTVNIDGLKGSEDLRMGTALRRLGIKTKKVHGVRDESEPLIRLADRMAGLVRDAKAGQQSYIAIVGQLETNGVLKEVS